MRKFYRGTTLLYIGALLLSFLGLGSAYALMGPTKTYSYDHSGRLFQVQHLSGDKELYNYDRNGNLINRTIRKYGGLYFDGINDKVSVGNIGARPTKGTIEFWMNSSDVQNYRNPFATNNWNSGIRFEQSATGNSLAVAIGDDAGNFTAHVYRPNNEPLIKGTWYHIALVWDSSQNKVWGYLNGEEVISGAAQTLWSSTFNDVKFGNGFNTSADRWFKGNMKDVRIWSVARSQNQIITGMNGINSNELGLMGRWTLNEGTGSIAYDMTNNARNGTISGAIWTQDPQRVLSFDGIDDKVSVGNIGARPTKGTVEFWMNSSDVQSYRNPFATNNGNSGIRFEQSATGNSLVVAIGDDAGNFTAHVYRSNNEPLIQGTWYHVALAWDSSQNKVWGYLNGDEVISGAAQTLWSSTFNDVKFGNGFNTSAERWFKGSMKDVRIWSVARSQNQIITGMNGISSNELGLMGRWAMNEGVGSIAYDMTNNARNGTISGAIWTQDPQRVLSFDGIDDKVSVGNIGARPTKGTVEFWMKSSDVQSYRNPFATNNGNSGIRFEQSATGNSLIVAIGDDAGNFTAHVYRSNNEPLIQGTWYHIALEWDSSQNKVWGYLNGDEVISGAAQTLWSSTFNDVKFGNGFNTSAERWFKGNMKDVRIWSVVRSRNQIITGMNGINSNELGLMGRWTLNEGTGAIAYDLTGNDRNGSIIGAQWTQ